MDTYLITTDTFFDYYVEAWRENLQYNPECQIGTAEQRALAAHRLGYQAALERSRNDSDNDEHFFASRRS